jgi:hypothetical protein
MFTASSELPLLKLFNISYRTHFRAYVSVPIRTHVTVVPSSPELISRFMPTFPDSSAFPQIDVTFPRLLHHGQLS